MTELQQWINRHGLTHMEAATIINDCLKTRYPVHRIKEWLGVEPYRNTKRPVPEKIERFARARL